MTRRAILALDQGTTSSRAIVFDRTGRPLADAQQAFPQVYPAPGQVTHDPEAIWDSQLATAREALDRSGLQPADVVIGIANQRETTLVWDRATGRPIGPAIVWQSRVSAPLCERLKADGHEPTFRARTGLPIDAYFSGPKIRHLLDADPALVDRAERGELAFGTVDSFLLWRLTGGRVHATDVSNASRTLLFDIERRAWDEELSRIVGVPERMLPGVKPTAGEFGSTDPELFGGPIPILALAGDQQAATFGQACLRPGDAKVTYGTGAFLLRNAGEHPVPSSNGLLSTILWQLGTSPAVYALEGSVFIAGAAIQWLRDGLGIAPSSSAIDELAASVDDSDGVVFVPALVGLGAPHWDPAARGLIIGLTRGTTAAHVARAALEAIACSVHDVGAAMAADAGSPLDAIRVDGGAASSDLLMQLQADVGQLTVDRPCVRETTAWGAAALAGLAAGMWATPEEVAELRKSERVFAPGWPAERAATMLARWQRAVDRSRDWETGLT